MSRIATTQQKIGLALFLVFASMIILGHLTARADDASSTDIEIASDTAPLTDTTTTIPDVAPTSTENESPIATSTPDTSMITTGDATAVANISNVVNVNIVDSQGFEALMNLFGPYLGNIDLSNVSFSPSDNCATCSGGSLDASNTNNADITNNVDVTANTGGNIIDASGTATIATGDATAVANVVNVANANIVGSNYLLVVLNNFNQLLGDIIFPGKNFFSDILNTSESTSPLADGSLAVSNNNVATVMNDTVTGANSGDNSVSGSSTADIATGNALSVANTVNDINTNITGNNQVYLLVRVFGTWNGQIFNTPPGLHWEETPDGLLLSGAGAAAITDGGCGCNGSTTVADTNTADVTNNIQVYALTGQNEIANGDPGTTASTTIATGNATAVSNVVNLVNTNVVGHNILLAIVNIFGDWEGNLAFGQPDLWVGAQADTSDNPLVPGSTITYHVTVVNRGSADATEVALNAADSISGITSVDDPDGGTATNDGLAWSLPDLQPGASTTITFTAHVNGAATLPPSFTENFSVSEHEDDANTTDNSDSVTFGLNVPSTFHYNDLPLSVLTVSDTNNATSTLPPGSDVHYRLLLGDGARNGPAQNVAVSEVLYSPLGYEISSSTWHIGNVGSGQKFLVQYDTAFSTSTPSGWYISYASLAGWDSGGDITLRPSIISSSSVYIVNPADYPAPTPPPVIVYVPAPISATDTIIGSGVQHSSIQALPQSSQSADKNLLSTGLSCSSNTVPNIHIPNNYLASIAHEFNGYASSIQEFFTSTVFIIKPPLFGKYR